MGRLVLAGIGLIGLVLAAIFAPARVSAISGLLPPVTGAVGTLVSIANVVASLSVLGVLVVIAVDALRRRHFAATCAAIACVLGIIVGILLALIVTAAAGRPAAEALTGPPDSAGSPVTFAVAFVVGADLQRRRWLGRARLALTAAVACALALGSLTLPSASYAVLLGAVAGLAVRVGIGVVPARPSEDLVRSVLERAGWQLRALRPREQSTGQVVYEGVRADGDVVRVTVMDPDLRGVPFARRAWRLLLLRTAAVGRPPLSLRGQLERQALSSALAESAGVAAPATLALLAAGPALLLVERPLAGTPFGVCATESAATETWCALRRAHDAGLALGGITTDQVVLLSDGQAGFAEVSSAQPAATELQRELDVVALLVPMGAYLGAEAAAGTLRAGYRTTPVTEARLAVLLQPLALPPRVRQEIRDTTLLADLRAAVSSPEAEATALAEPPRLERLRPRTVISVVGGTVAAYVLATQLSRVDVGSVLRTAHPEWLAVAALGAAVTFVGAALTRIAFSPVRLRLVRTTFVQLASSFLTLVTPPAVGHVGLNIRYLQRADVPTPAAAATVGVSEAVTVAVTVLLLLVSGWLSGLSSSRLALLPSGNVLAVLAVAAGVLALVVAVPATRRGLRRRLEPLVRTALPYLVTAVSDPRRLGVALLGILILNGGNILALDASLRAFSASLPVPTLIVVYLASSALGSAAPTPGGLGAVEAALVGGLTATGVPFAAALPAVLAFRAATFWLPAPLGWGAFVLLQRNGAI